MEQVPLFDCAAAKERTPHAAALRVHLLPPGDKAGTAKTCYIDIRAPLTSADFGRIRLLKELLDLSHQFEREQS